MGMEIEDYYNIITAPLAALIIIDFVDFLATHYGNIRSGIDPFIIDLLIVILTIPIYVFVVYTIVMKVNGDSEDAALTVLALAFLRWAVGWATGITLTLLLGATSGEGVPMPLVPFSNAIDNIITMDSLYRFLFHVVGAGIGAYIIGEFFVYGKRREEESTGEATENKED